MKKIIVGLGNPGKEYDNTRHNLGFQLVDKLALAASAEWKENKKFQALIAEAGNSVFIKPLTYMNKSGESVAGYMSYYKLLPKTLGVFKNKDANLSQNLIVAHDDLDLEFGKWKISTDSRSGGHRGVQSIIDHLKTKNFTRIRLGINSEKRKVIPTDKFVLMHFDDSEKSIIEKTLAQIKF
jgi:PTH1 family peptidyl-tRNA hydrolase